MKKGLFSTVRSVRFFGMAMALVAMVGLAGSCEQSEGSKYGLLQKVSHKTSPCDYYEIEVAYEGGVNTGTTEDPAFGNTQKFQIDRAAYDTLAEYQGERVVIEYADNGFQACGSSKWVTAVRIKQYRIPRSGNMFPGYQEETIVTRPVGRAGRDTVYVYRPPVDSMLPAVYDSNIGR